jgi:phospholipid-binding lipoprotein MlaA
VAIASPARDGHGAPDPLFDDDADRTTPDVPDPFESVNRVTFGFNRQFDRFVFEPVTKVLPLRRAGRILRRGLRRALVNLDAPVTLVNDVLQLEPRDAAVTVARFVVNSTGRRGRGHGRRRLEPRRSRGTSRTSARRSRSTGVPTGPYLMLPISDRTTARHGGLRRRLPLPPTTYLITPGGQVILSGFLNPGGEFLFTVFFEGSTELARGSRRARRRAKRLRARASSIDYYAALRSAYYQNRTALIWRRGPEHGPAARARQVLARCRLARPAARSSILLRMVLMRRRGRRARALR